MSVNKEAPSQLEAAMKRIEEQEENPLDVIRERRFQRSSGELMKLLDDVAPEGRERFTPRERRVLAALRRQRKTQNKAARKARRANR